MRRCRYHVNPACAGMIPVYFHSPVLKPSKPRVCGDDPKLYLSEKLTYE